MVSGQGSFLWYELLTSDPDAAQRFYADVVGWSIAPYPGNVGTNYRVLTAPDGGGVGGIAKSPGEGMPPIWLGYVGVADVDATVTAAGAAGGTVRLAPNDLPGIGRIALLVDPGGVPFYVMTPAGAGDSPAFATNAPGHCGWNELVAAALERDRDFYLGLFGWTVNGGMPMGDMGVYEFLEHAGERIGAAMQNPPGRGPAHWTFYFRVLSIAAARARIEAAGGTVTHGPIEVPGGEWILQGIDPQGAGFALVGSRD